MVAYTTFAAFQATRTECADIGAKFSFDEDRTVSGFVYADCCYIENNTRQPELGKYYLLIGRGDWISDDLTKLEALLFVEHFQTEVDGQTLKEEDDSVNDYVRTYCLAHGIECDGDAFGLMFSGAESWTVAEATRLIESAADIYNLRKRTPTLVPTEVPQYKREFGDFDLIVPDLPGLTDHSWHNNCSPSFTAEDRFLMELWVDYRDPSLREFQNEGSIFTLYELENDNGLPGVPDLVLLATDDLAEVMAFFYIRCVNRIDDAEKVREWLGGLYEGKVGYDPFKDDPSISATEVLTTLAGVLAEEFREVNALAEKEEPELPEVDEMMEAIKASEKALALCRNVLAKAKVAMDAMGGEAEGKRLHDHLAGGSNGS